MDDSAPSRVRIAILSADQVFRAGLAAWIEAVGDELAVVVTAEATGDLLTSPGFPTDLVVIDAGTAKRPIEKRTRTLRSTGAAVIVVTEPGEGALAARAVGAGAFCVLEKDVPYGLIAEMARAAVGLPLAGGVD